MPVRIIFSSLCHRIKQGVWDKPFQPSEAAALDKGVSAQHQDVFGDEFWRGCE